MPHAASRLEFNVFDPSCPSVVLSDHCGPLHTISPVSTFKWVKSASTAVLPCLSASRFSFLSFISSVLYFLASFFYFFLPLSERFRFLESLFFTFFPLYQHIFPYTVYHSLFPFMLPPPLFFSYYLYLHLGFAFLLTASVRFAPSCFPSLFLSLSVH